MTSPLALVQIALAYESPSIDHQYLLYPDLYLPEVLGIRLQFEHEGQIIDGQFYGLVMDIARSWLHMLQREAISQGKPIPRRQDLPDWIPGTPIVNTFCLQGGHKLGKSVVAAGIMAWCYAVSHSIKGCVYTPTMPQARDITWRYIDGFIAGTWHKGASRGPAVLRMKNSLKASRIGGMKSPELASGLDRMIKTQAVTTGVDVQGKHSGVGFHLFEEAEGINKEDIYEGVIGLTSGNVSLWLLCANPTSASSCFGRMEGDTVARYQFSCINHPNVRLGKSIVPNAVDRVWVDRMLQGTTAWAKPADGPNPENGHFQLSWHPGKWFRPLPPWYWRVDGVPSPTTMADALVSSAALKLAAKRDHVAIFAATSPRRATLGVDSAMGGQDHGAIARNWRGCVGIRRRIYARDGKDYVANLVAELEILLDGGCKGGEIRIDFGGGYGRWIDHMRQHPILKRFTDGMKIIECLSNGASYKPLLAADWITCAYMDVGEAIQTLAFVDLTSEIERDLTERRTEWVIKPVGNDKRVLKQLESKDSFRAHIKPQRSPDDGDAIALALANIPDRTLTIQTY